MNGTVLNVIREEHMHATMFIEDGGVSIYDWPPEIEIRPDVPLAIGGNWLFASGGGCITNKVNGRDSAPLQRLVIKL